jgi:hypothetical protein
MKKKARSFKPLKDRKQWNMHRDIAGFALGLDRPKDAAMVKKTKPRTAPLAMLDMVF